MSTGVKGKGTCFGQWPGPVCREQEPGFWVYVPLAGTRDVTSPCLCFPLLGEGVP